MISSNNHGIKCDHDSARGQHQTTKKTCFVSEMTEKEKCVSEKYGQTSSPMPFGFILNLFNSGRHTAVPMPFDKLTELGS